MRNLAKRSLNIIKVIVVAIGACAAYSADAADIHMFAMAPVRFALHGDDRIGARRSGLLCTPAGSLLWREVGADGQGLAARAGARLQAAGTILAVANADRMDSGVPASRFRIVATVEHLAMNGCMPWRGFNVGKVRGPVKGSGRIVVTWRVFDVASRELASKVASCQDFSIRRAPTLQAAVESAFGEAAQSVVPLLYTWSTSGRAGDPLALPPASTCAAGELPAAG